MSVLRYFSESKKRKGIGVVFLRTQRLSPCVFCIVPAAPSNKLDFYRKNRNVVRGKIFFEKAGDNQRGNVLACRTPRCSDDRQPSRGGTGRKRFRGKAQKGDDWDEEDQYRQACRRNSDKLSFGRWRNSRRGLWIGRVFGSVSADNRRNDGAGYCIGAVAAV